MADCWFSKGSREGAASQQTTQISAFSQLPAAHMDAQGPRRSWPCGHLHIACLGIKGLTQSALLSCFPA